MKTSPRPPELSEFWLLAYQTLYWLDIILPTRIEQYRSTGIKNAQN